jgi:NifU-like protein involved in Fe-S cluster formation
LEHPLTVARPFSDAVMEHFLHPRHAVPLPWPNGTAWIQSADQGKFIRIQVNVVDGRVTAVAFGTRGCAPAIACGSWVCEWASGRPVPEVLRLTAATVLEALGGLPDHRQEHAILSVRALHEAVSQAVSNPIVYRQGASP